MYKAALIAGLSAAAAAPALAAAPMTAAERDARIDALEAQVKAMAAELAALRQEQPAGRTTATAPTSAATADLGTGVTAGPSPARAATADAGTPAAAVSSAGAPRVFGQGVPSSAATARIDTGRPVITTADGGLSVSLLAVMQFDVADYFQPAAGPLATDLRRGGGVSDTAHARDLQDGSIFRRARFGVAGRAFGNFEYTALFDFGGSGVEDNGHVQELWLQYSGLKPFHLRVGAFPPSIGLEDQGSTNAQPFLERPASADLARGLAAGDYREAGEVVANGERWYVSAAITGRQVSTSGAATVQPYDSQRGFVGRVAAVAYRDDDTLVHLGAHGSYVDHPASTGGPDAPAGTATATVELRERPELRVDGTRLIDTGAIAAAHAYSAGVEGAVQFRNLLLQGEYEWIGIERAAAALADPRFTGFYVEGSWLLTGERRRYNTGNFAFDGPAVTTAFNPLAGQWGAFEVAGRYSSVDLDSDPGSAGAAAPPEGVRGGRQRIASAALNWYLNPIMRIMLQYQHVAIGRLSPNAATFLTPVGASIGQTYSTGAARFQFAF